MDAKVLLAWDEAGQPRCISVVSEKTAPIPFADGMSLLLLAALGELGKKLADIEQQLHELVLCTP